ncbi:MAG: hypothetical protein ICV71_05620 [Thermoleophilia bacterium]|nr:hypothetical protein [Thermoleophilia bacterium]
MWVRISDAALVGEFHDFLVRSGFVVEERDGDCLRLALPLTPGRERTQEDLDTLLTVWLGIGLRIWKDLRPDVDVVPLGTEAPSLVPSRAS